MKGAEKNNKDILNTIKMGVCSSETGMYSKVGSWNETELTYRDVREIKKDDGKDYYRVDETLTALPGYPALLTRWVGSITTEKKEGESKSSTKYELSGADAVKMISRSACLADKTCQRMFDGEKTYSCTIVVDQAHYRAIDPGPLMTSFNCPILKESSSIIPK